ncbi:hypothetical protein WA026_012076 [Henosepilachna vigintioctopunctata]|uniref:DUF19 domain-containing protein n=1 Tax=Henosepilachna vigintioctopunctata TaxID=420089 RepID=A0AAW1VB87_9CUCU
MRKFQLKFCILGRFKMSLLFLFLLVSLSMIEATPQEENIKKVGLPQFIIIENIINLMGNACSPSKNLEIKKAKQEAISCLGDLPASSTYCKFLFKDLHKCVKPLTEIIEECNKGSIFEGLLSGFVETFSQGDFICKRDGEQILELLNPCLFRSLELKEPCVNTFVTEVQSVTRTNKKLVDVTCQAAASAKNCLYDTIENECSRNSTRNALLEMYEASIKSCNLPKI